MESGSIKSYNDAGKILYDEPGAGWSTSNGGVAYIKGMDFILHCYSADKPNAVTISTDSKSGKAARLESLDTTGKWAFITSVPKGNFGFCIFGSV